MKILNSITMLKKMAKAGHIVLHKDTGKKVRHWTGCIVTAYYIDGIRTGRTRFRFSHPTKRGKDADYQIRYFDGCFYPFVVILDEEGAPPSFV